MARLNTRNWLVTQSALFGRGRVGTLRVQGEVEIDAAFRPFLEPSRATGTLRGMLALNLTATGEGEATGEPRWKVVTYEETSGQVYEGVAVHQGPGEVEHVPVSCPGRDSAQRGNEQPRTRPTRLNVGYSSDAA